jgi:hypothetical protein
MLFPASRTTLIYGKDNTTGLDAPIGVAAGVQASGTLTSNNTIPSDGDTVTIGGITYTLKTALTPTEGQVLINGSADAALLNLIRAINASGVNGVDYYTRLLGGHPDVTAATSVTAHAFLVTARDYGVAGNAIATTENDGSTARLSWGATTLTGGTNASLATSINQSSPGSTNAIQTKQYAGVPSAFSPATADGTVFTLAAGEIGFIQNLSADAPLAVKKGASASTSSFNLVLAACTVQDDGKGGFVTIDDWIGIVSVAKITGTGRYIAYKIAVT